MSTRWHFDNNAERAQNYRKLDTNIDHYKSKFDYPYKPKNDYQQKDYQVGVSMTYIDGSYFRTNNFTEMTLQMHLKAASVGLNSKTVDGSISVM